MDSGDTIAALSSAAGAAPRMVVRVSGPLSLGLAGILSRRRPEGLPAGAALRVGLHFAGLTLPAWLYLFHGPNSYTGEDAAEFHIPGNPLLARMLLDHLVAAGARQAGPGEFTARSFFNGRIDLAGAEGVAATIAAGNEQELAAARRLMAGELATRLRPAMDAVADALALVEAGIDFAEEEGVTFLTPSDLRDRVGAADALLHRLLKESTRFERLSHEPTAVLVGRPNAGKSTLLNALAGHDRAVTSPVAGTTRDALSAEVALPRGFIRLIDVAGLDESPVDEPPVATAGFDVVEAQMRGHARRAIETADFVVLVRETTDHRPPLTVGREPDLVVESKCDLAPPNAAPPEGQGAVAVSAATGKNLEQLRGELDRMAFGSAGAGAGLTLALNARHVEAVGDARQALARAAGLSDEESPEIVAVELREALDAMGRVLGAVTPDDLLGRIFSTFCIGK